VPNGVGVSLARNRRSPKRPSEPRLSGVHPEEAEVGERWRSLPSVIARTLDYGPPGRNAAGREL